MKPRFLLVIYLALTVLSCNIDNSQNKLERKLPNTFLQLIDSVHYQSIGGVDPGIRVDRIEPSVVRVELSYDLPDSLFQDDWQLELWPSFQADFFWAPHLTPTDEHIIAQHLFRAPSLIMSDSWDGNIIVMIPDLDILNNEVPVKWYMDMDAGRKKMTLGMSNSLVREHVLFIRDSGARYPPGELKVAFYLMAETNPDACKNPWRKPSEFMWKKWGRPLYNAGQPLDGDLETYTKHTYDWAFENWKEAVWQEFELDGNRVGAPVFIVNVTQSPNYPGHVDEREFRSIWNQAWFSSLRSASGLYRYARRIGDNDLLEKAKMTKELALAFPQTDGLFPGLIATEMERVKIDGKEYNRSKGWDYYYFGNSNRNPYTRDPKRAPLHILDMSWTCYLMLQWYEELEKDQRLLDYSKRYADKLLKLQSDKGYFPGWLDPVSHEVLPILNESPESSMSVSFLLKLFRLTAEEKYRASAFKALDRIIEEILPAGQWEDYETYWSCCSFGRDTLVNRKISRNDMFKQNTLSIFWTSQALLAAYKLSGENEYLNWGRRTLDELLMAQQVWQPPYMFINTLGGFGVMNADGEWNDSRETLFAELILEYGKILDCDEYMQRGISALKSGFVMMYCPENPKTKIQWEKKYPYFDERDYGFTMENYGHGGVTNAEGLGIGVFTIYDWGNGAAAEAYMRILDHGYGL